MKCKITKTIKQHLGYLGYSVQDRSNPNDPTDLLSATHPRRSNILIYINEEEVIYIKAYYNEFAMMRYSDMLNEVNETNKNTVLTKWRVLKYDDDKELLNLSSAACLIGYDKNTFTSFLDLFEVEISDHLPVFEPYTLENNRILISQIVK
jgi:hypothetical protein